MAKSIFAEIVEEGRKRKKTSGEIEPPVSSAVESPFAKILREAKESKPEPEPSVVPPQEPGILSTWKKTFFTPTPLEKELKALSPFKNIVAQAPKRERTSDEKAVNAIRAWANALSSHDTIAGVDEVIRQVNEAYKAPAMKPMRDVVLGLATGYRDEINSLYYERAMERAKEAAFTNPALGIGTRTKRRDPQHLFSQIRDHFTPTEEELITSSAGWKDGMAKFNNQDKSIAVEGGDKLREIANHALAKKYVDQDIKFQEQGRPVFLINPAKAQSNLSANFDEWVVKGRSTPTLLMPLKGVAQSLIATGEAFDFTEAVTAASALKLAEYAEGTPMAGWLIRAMADHGLIDIDKAKGRSLVELMGDAMFDDEGEIKTWQLSFILDKTKMPKEMAERAEIFLNTVEILNPADLVWGGAKVAKLGEKVLRPGVNAAKLASINRMKAAYSLLDPKGILEGKVNTALDKVFPDRVFTKLTGLKGSELVAQAEARAVQDLNTLENTRLSKENIKTWDAGIYGTNEQKIAAQADLDEIRKVALTNKVVVEDAKLAEALAKNEITPLTEQEIFKNRDGLEVLKSDEILELPFAERLAGEIATEAKRETKQVTKRLSWIERKFKSLFRVGEASQEKVARGVNRELDALYERRLKTTHYLEQVNPELEKISKLKSEIEGIETAQRGVPVEGEKPVVVKGIPTLERNISNLENRIARYSREGAGRQSRLERNIKKGENPIVYRLEKLNQFIDASGKNIDALAVSRKDLSAAKTEFSEAKKALDEIRRKPMAEGVPGYEPGTRPSWARDPEVEAAAMKARDVAKAKFVKHTDEVRTLTKAIKKARPRWTYNQLDPKDFTREFVEGMKANLESKMSGIQEQVGMVKREESIEAVKGQIGKWETDLQGLKSQLEIQMKKRGLTKQLSESQRLLKKNKPRFIKMLPKKITKESIGEIAAKLDEAIEFKEFTIKADPMTKKNLKGQKRIIALEKERSLLHERLKLAERKSKLAAIDVAETFESNVAKNMLAHAKQTFSPEQFEKFKVKYDQAREAGSLATQDGAREVLRQMLSEDLPETMLQKLDALRIDTHEKIKNGIGWYNPSTDKRILVSERPVFLRNYISELGFGDDIAEKAIEIVGKSATKDVLGKIADATIGRVTEPLGRILTKPLQEKANAYLVTHGFTPLNELFTKKTSQFLSRFSPYRTQRSLNRLVLSIGKDAAVSIREAVNSYRRVFEQNIKDAAIASSKVAEFAPDEQRMIREIYMGEREAVLTRDVSQAMLDVARETKQAIDNRSALLVRAGILSPESYLNYQGKYLKRDYEIHISAKEFSREALDLFYIGDASTSSARMKKIYQRELNEDVARELGVIIDLPYEIASTTIDQSKRVGVSKFHSLIDRSGLAITRKEWELLDASEKAMYGEIKVGLSSSLSGLDSTDSAILANFRNEMKKGSSFEQAAIAVTNSQHGSQLIRDILEKQWNSAETLKGSLKGQLVPVDLADFLNVALSPKGLDEWGKFGRGIYGLWKFGKTVGDFGVQAGNVMGDAVFMELAGVSIFNPTTYDHIAEAVKLRKSGKGFYDEAVKAGIVNTSFKNEFIDKDMNEILKEIYRLRGGNIERAGPALVYRIMNLPVLRQAGQVYQAADDLAKLTAFIKYRKGGASIEKASEVVKTWFPNYRDIPQGVKDAENLPIIGLPFISFKFESARILKNALTMPQGQMKLAAWTLLATQIREGMMSGMDESERDAFSMMSQQQFLSPFTIPTPFKALDGKPMAFDFGRWMPFTGLIQTFAPLQLFTAGKDKSPNERRRMLNQGFGQFALQNPVYGAVLKGAFGFDKWKGRLIDQPEDTESETLYNRTYEVLKDLSPSFGVNPFRLIDGWSKKGTGNLDKKALLMTEMLMGMKIRPMDLAEMDNYVDVLSKVQLNELTKRAKSLTFQKQNGVISEKSYNAKISRIKSLIDDLSNSYTRDKKILSEATKFTEERMSQGVDTSRRLQDHLEHMVSGVFKHPDLWRTEKKEPNDE